MDRPQIGRVGLAVALFFLLLPETGRSEDNICGHPARGRVVISRDSRTIAEFTVAEAVSPTERSRGLMHCPALRPGTGMLFIYEDIRPRAFWMKDTPLKLGIIFIAADGRITAIEKGMPQSLTRIPSPGPARFVLEVNHHEARQFQVGDRVRRIEKEPGSRSSSTLQK